VRRADGSLGFGGPGEPVEWALLMRRFETTLDVVAEEKGLDAGLVLDLAEIVAAAHAAAPVRDAAAWLADVGRYIEDNEAAFLARPDLFPPARVHELSASARAHLARLSPVVEARGRQGLVRLCHGDCHLRNIALFEGRAVLFDAIEFDDRIATSDVLYDLAFLLMDLWERDMADEANLVFNRYLHLTRREADLEGLVALPFYMMLRAAIRAMVEAARAPRLQGAAREDCEREAVRYFETAEMLLEPLEPLLVGIGGLSGSGKSTLARHLAPGLGRPPGAVLLRSDLERKAMFGVPDIDKLPRDAYEPEVTTAVYHRLCNKARAVLAAGHAVIFDAVFAREDERQALARVAEAVEAPFIGIWLDAPAEVLIDRVETRTGDASDADREIVLRQLRYDLGSLDWHRIDAGNAFETTLAAALRAIAGDTGTH